MLKENQDIAARFIETLELGKPFIDINTGKPITSRTRKPISKSTSDKYMRYLKAMDRIFNKPFKDLTEEDIDKFRIDLRMDKIKSNKNKPYRPSVKMDIEKKIIKPLLNYLGKTALANFSISYSDQIEIPALSKQEIERCISQSRLRDKVIIQILFDGGFRIDEFSNIKFNDVKDDCLKSDGYYKIRITKSKTKPRTIGLTLPLSTELLKDWLAENQDKIGTNQPLIDMNKRSISIMLKRIGKRILNKNVFPHLLRHSSATYFCHILNQYQMCKRYGWGMASDMPQRYIDREGVDDETANKKVITEENITISKQINILREQLQAQKEQMKLLQEQIKEKIAEGIDA